MNEKGLNMRHLFLYSLGSIVTCKHNILDVFCTFVRNPHKSLSTHKPHSMQTALEVVKDWVRRNNADAPLCFVGLDITQLPPLPVNVKDLRCSYCLKMTTFGQHPLPIGLQSIVVRHNYVLKDFGPNPLPTGLKRLDGFKCFKLRLPTPLPPALLYLFWTCAGFQLYSIPVGMRFIFLDIQAATVLPDTYPEHMAMGDGTACGIPDLVWKLKWKERVWTLRRLNRARCCVKMLNSGMLNSGRLSLRQGAILSFV